MNGQLAVLDELPVAEAVATAGPKIGRLVEMSAAGVPVPRGFVLTCSAYRRYCTESGLDSTIGAIIAELPAQPSIQQLEATSAAIRAAFGDTTLSPALTSAISEAYRDLCVRAGEPNMPVAVRSSAAGEDDAQASFAGMFDSCIGVSGSRRVSAAIRTCWASSFTTRALGYRLQHHDIPMAVGVLELIRARSSGIAFSLHPVTGKTDRIVIEGSWGFGEAVAQGRVTPDHAEVGKTDLRVLRYDIACKDVVSKLDRQAGRTIEQTMPERLRLTRAVDDNELCAIARRVREVELHYGFPVDVEWVIPGHRRGADPVYIVQVRPVTVRAAAPTFDEWNAALFGRSDVR